MPGLNMAHQPQSTLPSLSSSSPDVSGIYRGKYSPLSTSPSDIKMADEQNTTPDRRLSFTERLAIARAKSEEEVRMSRSIPALQPKESFLPTFPAHETMSPEEPTTKKLSPEATGLATSKEQEITCKRKMESSVWSKPNDQETHISPSERIETGEEIEDLPGTNLRTSSQVTVEGVQKRGRGRPKGSKNQSKATVKASDQPEPQPELAVEKRGRDRPKGSKCGVGLTVDTLDQPEQQPEETVVKRGRGLPRGSNKSAEVTVKSLDQQPEVLVMKRGRGRPRGKKIHWEIITEESYEARRREIESAHPPSLSAPEKRRIEQEDDGYTGSGNDSKPEGGAPSHEMKRERRTKRLKGPKD